MKKNKKSIQTNKALSKELKELELLFKNVQIGVEPDVLPDRFCNSFTLGYNTFGKIIDPLTNEVIPRRDPIGQITTTKYFARKNRELFP